MATNNTDRTNVTSDLQDSEKDIAAMKSDPVYIDLPDVKDIPGQENVVPASLGELADVTISSSDEEGDDIFDDDVDEETEADSDSDVTEEEKQDLEETANDMPTSDDTNLHEAALDDVDEDGEPLNERSSKTKITGTDLDVPGSEDDDDDEEIGEEDEENNDYSIGGDDNDNIPQDEF